MHENAHSPALLVRYFCGSRDMELVFQVLDMDCDTDEFKSDCRGPVGGHMEVPPFLQGVALGFRRAIPY